MAEICRPVRLHSFNRRVLPLIVVLSVTESKIGIDVTNEGCW